MFVAERQLEEDQGKSFDLLRWWINNRSRYPRLFLLAEKFLVVPATSASVERQFSRAGRIKSVRRQSLDLLKFQALVFLGENQAITAGVVDRMREEEQRKAEKARRKQLARLEKVNKRRRLAGTESIQKTDSD
jgi:hypothetical protein